MQSTRLNIIAVNVFIADTWDLSGLINSSSLMLHSLSVHKGEWQIQAGWQANAAEQFVSSKRSEMNHACEKYQHIFYSCSVVEVSRVLSCLCSVNLVPVKHSVSVSLLKHYSQATERGRGGKNGGNGREEEAPQLPVILSSFNRHALFFLNQKECKKKVGLSRQSEDESDQEARWKRGGVAGGQRTCVQSRKVCSPSSSDRQTGLSGQFIFTSI